MMETIIVEGTMTSATVYAPTLDELSRKQIQQVCCHPAFDGSSVRIMPDVHAGKGCVIGFTASFDGNLVVPNLIGVDIGCGVLSAALNEGAEINDGFLSSMDAKMKNNIPHGFGVRTSELEYIHQEFPDLIEEINRISIDVLKDGRYDYHLRSLGTLGGGNHFVEITRDDQSNLHYLHVHSGSRHFGNCIAEYYQKLAIETCRDRLPDALKYLSGDLSKQYLRDMRVAQWFARVNRRLIVREMLGDLSGETFDTIHNYISDDNIIRKGAVSAAEGEMLLVPLNMRDGSLLCRGKGNSEYNCSSPHGAGRVYSRKKARENIALEEYMESMKGVYTSCVSQKTIDEAPMAYKPASEIEAWLLPTAEITARLRPVYNFKAA